MEFIGHKGAALLDLWSVSHFLFGVALGGVPLLLAQALTGVATPAGAPRPTRSHSALSLSLITLLLAFAWEALEYTLEAGSGGEALRDWLQGHEHWLNRLISDPLLVLLGFRLALWRPDMVWPARAMLLIWAFVFVFVFEHSMAYLG